MNMPARQMQDQTPAPLTPEQEAAVKAASAWVNQLARTLKTCRLYDANNPTVLRFRDDLSSALRRVLEEHGAMTLRFTAEDVLCEGQSLYPARSRDDNLALAFYQDGIRALTLAPGADAREVEALLDGVLQVSGQAQGQDDLVTLLWEAQLRHIEVDYVPADGEVGGGPIETETVETVPWPTGGAFDEDAEEQREEGAAGGSRSDDWSVGEETQEIEAGWEELEALAPTEVERFRREYEAEHAVGTVTATVAIARAYLTAGAGAEDREEMRHFLPRVLRQAVTHGRWLEARESLLLLRECGESGDALAAIAQELLQPISVSGAVEKLDQQDPPAVRDFVAFARELGDPAVDWLNLVLAESQQRANRRALAEAIADLCRDNPERLAPWLSDPRWFVVRNVVHILGWIGGSGIVGLLQAALRHPDARVRQEVVAALGQVEPRHARPLLVRLLAGNDTKMFCAVLHQLSAAKDERTARLLLSHMQADAFEQRPIEEKRALYSALAAVGGDEVVPELEAELHKGNWFARSQEAHRQAVARCLARMGTPLARTVLERGLTSRRGPVRKACEDALGGVTSDD